MKIALLLSGYVDDNFSFKAIKENILDHYDTDVYCQYWYLDNDQKQLDYDTIVQAYNPKKIKAVRPISRDFNWYKDIKKYFNIVNQVTYNQISQLLSFKIVSNLVDWSQYDFVIKTRYSRLILYKFPNLYNLDKNKFYTPYHYYDTFWDKPDIFCDPVLIMPNYFKEFSLVFDLLRQSEFRQGLRNINPGIFCGFGIESVLGYALKYLNLNDQLVKMKREEFLFDFLVTEKNYLYERIKKQ